MFFCVLFFANQSFAQSSNTAVSDKGIFKNERAAKLDELLTRYAMYGFSGTVLLVKDNRIIINKGFGFADAGRGKQNTKDTLFDVGSIAKTFTAAAILQLEMRGKLKTDDLISKYLGEFPADKSTITIHHLLTHHAGLGLDARDAGVAPTDSREEFLQKTKNAPLISAPGAKYNYSNLGYALLANIIETVSGDSWQEYLRVNLLKPAGLKQTKLYGENVSGESLALGYIGMTEEDLKLEEPLRPQRQDSYLWGKYVIGAVGVLMTTGDLYKWWQALNSGKILSENARRKMFTIQSGNQGFGWNIGTVENEITRIHRGGLRGSFQSLIAYYPKENALLIFALNKNVGEGAPLWASVGWSNLEKIVLGKDYVLPPEIASFSQEKLSDYTGEYQLTTGEKFIAWAGNNSLLIGASGQTAVNLLAYSGQSPPDFQDKINETGKQFIEWLSKNDLPQIKNANYLPEKDLAALRAKWDSWVETIGEIKSVQILGTSPGTRGFPRTFVKLGGEKTSVVVRLLWDWDKKKLLAWGDDIQLPAISKFSPESETSFINFDFNKSQTLRVRFEMSSGGKVNGLILASVDGKTEVFARKVK